MPLQTVRRAIRRVRYGQPIVVVSGLPRSGTSMMMQMLEAGGLEIVSDGVRTADESNPLGYYELERVKDLESVSDWSWLGQARGRAVKVIAYLVRYLPSDFNYKVVFMHRTLDEVLASQTKMLTRRGEADDSDDARLRELYVDHLARTRSLLAHRPCFETLYVRYQDVLVGGLEQAARVNAFLGGRLDPEAMAGVVDPSLYRNRG